jgi:hypothetical protein
LIELKYVLSGDNVADILTKLLPHGVLKDHIKRLDLQPIAE